MKIANRLSDVTDIPHAVVREEEDVVLPGIEIVTVAIGGGELDLAVCTDCGVVVYDTRRHEESHGNGASTTTPRRPLRGP